MEQSSSQADSSSTSQESLCILWNLKVHYHVDKNVPLVHFNIILPSVPRSSEWYLYFRFPHWNSICISALSCVYHMSHVSNPFWFVHLVWSTDCECHIMQFSSSFCYLSPNDRILVSFIYETHLNVFLCVGIQYSHRNSVSIWRSQMFISPVCDTTTELSVRKQDVLFVSSKLL